MSEKDIELYLIGILLFILSAIASYNVTKICIKYRTNAGEDLILNNEYRRIHNAIYKYKYYNIQENNNEEKV
jgi:hypothetical protein